VELFAEFYQFFIVKLLMGARETSAFLFLDVLLDCLLQKS
jgi:hypothetical protein